MKKKPRIKASINNLKTARRAKAIKKSKRNYMTNIRQKISCICGMMVSLRELTRHKLSNAHHSGIAGRLEEAFDLYYYAIKGLKPTALPGREQTTEQLLSATWRCLYCGLQFRKTDCTMETHKDRCAVVWKHKAMIASRNNCLTRYTRLACAGYVFGKDNHIFSKKRLFFSTVIGLVVKGCGKCELRGRAFSQFVIVDEATNWISSLKCIPDAVPTKCCVVKCQDTDPRKVPCFPEGSIVILRRVLFVQTSEKNVVYLRFSKGTTWIMTDSSGGSAFTGTAGPVKWDIGDREMLDSFIKWVVIFNEKRRNDPGFCYGSTLWPCGGKNIPAEASMCPFDLNGYCSLENNANTAVF